MPQLTAIAEVRRAIQESILAETCTLIADGGIRSAGDAIKCMAFGADCVMLGSMLAGCDESCSERVGDCKRIRGMASEAALAAHQGSRQRYWQEEARKLTPEGVEGLVKATGPLANVLQRFCGGLGSGLAHSGAATWAEFKPTCWRQTGAGIGEGRPHSIQ